MSTYATTKFDPKSVNVILARDNANQHQWYDAVQSYCQKRSSIKFLYTKYNVSKQLTPSDIQQAPVRTMKKFKEPKEEPAGDGGEEQKDRCIAVAVYTDAKDLNPQERRALV